MVETNRLYSTKGFGLTKEQEDAIEMLGIWGELSSLVDLKLDEPLRNSNPKYRAETPEEKARLETLLSRKQYLELRFLQRILVSEPPII